MTQKKEIALDIITSAYNEEECLPELFARIEKVMYSESNYSWRIIVFDNGSVDRTWEVIKSASKKNSQIHGFRMSRNFTLDAALTAGLDFATGDVAILMTSDLQDPPEAIPHLLRKFEDGFEQVLVKVVRRDQVPFLRRKLSSLFYKTAKWLTNGMLPELVSDFRLLNKPAYKAISGMKESHRFLRGLGAWVGFRTSYIEIERPPRFAGESSWLKASLISVISYGLKSIFSHTARPLLWVSGFGAGMSLLSLFSIIVMSLFWIFGSVPFAGFGTIVGLICLGFSLTMLCIGILAQYLALIYEEVKQRPLYIVAESTS